jgi:serine/threonine protein kinase
MQRVIGNKYKVLEMIGRGAFGVILKGEHIRTREQVAIKMERTSEQSFMLKNESKIYLLLNKEDQPCGFPNLRWFGKDEQFFYMVMDLLGESLVKSDSNVGASFPLNVVMKIGAQIIDRIRVVHEKGLIHRDVKPENFLFGLGRKSQTVHLIDFGFCKSYLDVEGAHVSMMSGKTMIGTPNFASVNVHNGLSHGRRDDIESCIYTLLYLFLPLKEWNEIFRTNLTNEEIKIVKIGVRELSSDVPSQLKNILIYCDKLGYEEEPNYRLIINALAT